LPELRSLGPDDTSRKGFVRVLSVPLFSVLKKVS